MAPIPEFNDQVLQAICNVIGDTSDGLTGSEIGRILGQCGIDDPFPGITKRDRLFQALKQRQQQDRCANYVINFIQKAMAPVRFMDQPAMFDQMRGRLNEVLAFAGYQIGSDGQLRQSTTARTISEAEERAGRLRTELLRRAVHRDVIRFCRPELLVDDYFHAVLEATKSLADKIREKTGLTSDGSELIDAAFGLKNGPKLAFNTLSSDSERSEHTGMMSLMKGLFSMFRNPTAHEPRLSWIIREQDALDLLTMVSLIHRRLDQSVRTGL